MRNILTILISLLSFVAVSAQTQHSIIIDAESLAPVQTDIMSGVAIDKIGLDTSRRPCARIKMHVNRMTREEIDGIVVQSIGGSVVVMKQIVAAEGNGLIIELTAKQPTRFYLHHDKYGDSNEVSLNLEGDKEYRLSAELNISYPIVINSNVKGAEVYVDGIYKGVTNDDYGLTINDIMPGAYSVRIKHGAAAVEQQIEVSSENIYFRIEVNTATSRAQYVVFNVVPVDAVVLIDNKDYTPDANGVVMLSLQNGTYTYEVLADEYHSAKGTFLVSGAKVVERVELKPAYGWLSVGGSGTLANAKIYVDNKHIGTTPITRSKLSSGTHSIRVVKSMYHTLEDSITICDNEELKYAPTLVADFATVTFDAGSGCDIYINNERKGPSPWTGKVASGTYIVEARKDGHRTTTISQSISSTPSTQTYKLDSPAPILGTINVTSTPLMADIYVDGKLVGETPLIYDLLVGTHEISVQMSGYRKSTQRVTIAENKTENLNISLQKGSDNTKKNVIEYVMPDKKMEILNAYHRFGSNVISHIWDPDTGKGVITFMNDVTTIGDGAFYKCGSLTSLTIPNGVTAIGYAAFYSCSSLTSVTIGDSVTAIGDWAFRDCSSLTSVTIPDSVTTIGDYAFRKCESLTSVTIPDRVTTIGTSAFSGCSSLQEFNGKFASEDGRCLIIDGVLNSFAPGGLVEYTIPDSVTEIGVAAFYYCRSLNSLTIPYGVTAIGEATFAACTSLTSITIPDSVTKIGDYPFHNCISLQEFKGKFASEDGRCLIIDGVLNSFAPGGLVEYTIPDSVTAIGVSAFDNCSNLTSVTIPDRVTEIGDMAFYDCSSLTSVTIPDSITSIGEGAFYYCSSLTSVYCKPTIPPSLGADALSNIASSRKIYVPMQSVEQYKKSNGWKEYKDAINGYNF